jgi:hypothetical protein
MTTKQLKNIADNAAGILAIYFAWKEVAFPWCILSLALAYMFCIWSSMTWGNALYPKKSTIEAGVISYLSVVITGAFLASVPLLLIFLIPGSTPIGLLNLASVYGFLSTILFIRNTPSIT